jgi:putative membrane protein
VIDIFVSIGVTIIAILHLWFCILEMFLWTKPFSLKIFRINQEFAHQSASLAANQGIYNGFLSAGLLWGLLSGNPEHAFHLKVFFLSCIVIAGTYAGLSVNRRILFVQALPAAVTLILLYFSK